MSTSEAELLRRIRSVAPNSNARSAIALGIGDDAALLTPRCGYEIILTCDWFLEGTHFLRDQHPPDSVGWKSLARAVSDIAAMGGQPRCFLLGLGVPEGLSGRWLDGFLGGLRRASRRLDCPLAGGDTTCRREVLLHITVVGEVRQSRGLRRSGARPGDLIYVTGRLGEAELGFRLLQSGRQMGRSDRALKKHLYPEPRLAAAQWLAKTRLATAAMDLSDGLSTDLSRLCASSQVGAVIDASEIPKVVVPKVNRADLGRASGRGKFDALSLALNGGDDYELLFTVAPGDTGRLPSKFADVPLTAIGKITRERSVLLTGAGDDARTLKPAGWDPFRR